MGYTKRHRGRFSKSKRFNSTRRHRGGGLFDIFMSKEARKAKKAREEAREEAREKAIEARWEERERARQANIVNNANKELNEYPDLAKLLKGDKDADPNWMLYHDSAWENNVAKKIRKNLELLQRDAEYQYKKDLYKKDNPHLSKEIYGKGYSIRLDPNLQAKRNKIIKAKMAEEAEWMAKWRVENASAGYELGPRGTKQANLNYDTLIQQEQDRTDRLAKRMYLNNVNKELENVIKWQHDNYEDERREMVKAARWEALTPEQKAAETAQKERDKAAAEAAAAADRAYWASEDGIAERAAEEAREARERRAAREEAASREAKRRAWAAEHAAWRERQNFGPAPYTYGA